MIGLLNLVEALMCKAPRTQMVVIAGGWMAVKRVMPPGIVDLRPYLLLMKAPPKNKVE